MSAQFRKSVFGLFAYLILVGFHLLCLAAEVDGLAHEIALNPRVRVSKPSLGFAIGMLSVCASTVALDSKNRV